MPDAAGGATALLLVDVQRDFLDRDGLCPSPHELTSRLRALLAHWRELGRPILHVRTRVSVDGSDSMPHWRTQGTLLCIDGTRGYEPPEGLEEHAGEPVFHKRFFSAFGASGLAAALDLARIETLVVAGLYTHGCVRASVLDAYERGFQVFVADDAVGSTEPLHAALSRSWLSERAARFLPSTRLVAQLTPGNDIPPADGGTAQALASPSVRELAATCSNTAKVAACWAERDPMEWAGLLERWAERIEDESIRLTQLMGREIGKPVTEGADELRRTVAHVRSAAGLCSWALEAAIGTGARVRYRPVGTVAAITPWNNPLAIPASKLAAALAFGNGCVWKPSPRAPACSALLLGTLKDAGLPQGLVAMMPGDAVAAQAIVLDPHIDAVSVTGSHCTGQAIAALCATRNMPLQAELGGNNAALILDDWDFCEADLAGLARAAFGFAGQRCTAIRRLIVQRGVLPRFTRAFAAVVESLIVGDPLDPLTQVGPLICARHRATIQSSLDFAIAGGARILARSSLPRDAEDAAWAGRWLAPTLLGDVDTRSPIAQEETFGPVVLVLPADDLDQAITIANAVPQGLVATLYSNDDIARSRFAGKIEAGMLKLSPGPLAISADAPFCGWKESAIGPPEHGIWDREFYARVQTVYQ